jgi:hypothetical protein
LEVDHGGKVEVFAEFLGGLVELGVSHAVDLLFYVEDFFHQVNALVVVRTLR